VKAGTQLVSLSRDGNGTTQGDRPALGLQRDCVGQFAWASPGAMMWRLKLGAFCRMLNLNPDNYKTLLKEWYGTNWIYHLRPLIHAIKLPEFFSEAESRSSMRAVWTMAVRERERRCNRKRRDVAAVRLSPDSFPTQPVSTWGTWIERTIKEDA